MTRLTLNAKLENKKIKLWKPNKKLTLNAKLENNSGSQTKRLTLKAKLRGPQVKTYGGDTIKKAHRCLIYGGETLKCPQIKIHGGEITEMPIDS